MKNSIVMVRTAWFLLLMILVVGVRSSPVSAQQTASWTSVQTILGYHPETEPPVLIADQNRTVHAFSSQFTGKDESSEKVIMYNKWTLAGGWTEPNDIILPPLKGQARLLDAELDETGMMHVLFFSGDEIEADIYYSQAPAKSAGQAQAWSEPQLVGENPLVPENGALIGDELGNMLIVYSGKDFSHGLYAVYSNDGGSSWSDPEAVFLTYRYDLWPFYLKMFLGDSGLVHTVWSVQNIDNQGQEIYYANFSLAQKQWSKPLQLAQSQGGLGTQVPTLIEYDGSLIVTYYSSTESGKQYLIVSSDGGESWTNPVAPFPHIGLNGPGSFVVDSNNDLHLFWGQRIPTDPAIHGMWHSVWNGIDWSPYEAIVTGLKILDRVGDTSFDPNTATPVVNQGNVLLVTWRTDRGSKGNGVWFSYKILDAPETPVSPLPEPQNAVDGTAEPIIDRPTLDVSPSPSPTLADVNFNDASQASSDASNPVGPLLAGLIPVVLLFGLIIVYQLIRNGS